MKETDTITPEELKRLWEWCGFKWARGDGQPYDCYHWLYPNHKQRMDLPELTLDNLFKYAVPKLQSLGWMTRVQFSPLRDNDTGKQIYDWTGYASLFYVKSDKTLSMKHDAKEAIDPKPEVALAKAILEVIK